jgi:hypothetical protein
MVVDASAKRKYKLSAADAEGVRTCAFFSTLVGCKSGSTCKFVHPGETTAGSQAAAAKVAADSAPKSKVKAKAAVVADDSDEVVAPVKKNKKAKAAAAAAAAAAEAAEAEVEEPAPVAKKAKKAKAVAAQVPETAAPPAAAPKKAKKAAAAAAPADTEVAAADDGAAAAGGSSKKICVFFKKGTCRSGAECEFAHIKGATRGPSKNSETGRAAAAEKAAAKPAKPAAAAKAVAAAAPAKAAAVKAAAAPAKPATKKAAAAAVPAAKAAKSTKKAVVAPPPAAVQVDSDDDAAAAAESEEEEEEAAPVPVRKTRAAVAAALKPAAVKPVAPAAAATAKTPKRKAAAVAAPEPAADDDDPFGLVEDEVQQQPSAKRLRVSDLVVPQAPAEMLTLITAAQQAAAAVKRPVARAAAKPVPRAPPSTPVVPIAAAAVVRRSAAKPAAAMPPPAAAPVPVASVHSLLAALPISPFPASALEPRGAAAARKRAAAAAAAPVVIPHPRADVWADLVARTRAHPAYAQLYGFQVDESWSTAAPCGPRCAGLPQVVALDCEMCMTKDTATGECNGKDLVRLSVVEGGAGATVLDTLVRPSNPVVEMRSSIHGVTPRILEGVAFDAGHAQTAMAALCCPCTVMIGHALHNDLAALKMAHSAVVDTALLYAVEGAPINSNATPNLRDCAKSVLDKAIQAGAHDSVTDAVTALEVAKFALGKAELPLITRGIAGPKPGREQGGGSSSARAQRNASSLLVHRLPRGVAARHLSALFSKKAMILPQAVGEPEFAEGNPHGKAIVVFPSEVHANLAFCTLKGAAKPDATGRLQKKVFLANGGYIQVRKMCTEKRSRRHGNILNKGDAGGGGSAGPEAGELDESSDNDDEMEVDDDLDDADIEAEDDSGDD